jgi:hypothetical protein
MSEKRRKKAVHRAELQEQQGKRVIWSLIGVLILLCILSLIGFSIL